MRVLVVNLDKDKERMESIDAQLRRLGVEYERVSGVYAKTMPDADRKKAVDSFRWWCAVGRPVVDAEIGCALSHYGIYRTIGRGEVVCILEDDVIIDAGFRDRLDEIAKFADSQKPQVFILSSHEKPRIGTGIIKDDSGMCTDGYAITYAAAQALLGANLPMQVPCDTWARWAKRRIVEIYHVLPVSVRQNQEVFGTSTQANADDVSKFPLLKWCLHKAKRIVGKTIDSLLIRF